MMITIVEESGKFVARIDQEVTGVYAKLIDACDAIDAWARAALGFGVEASDYYLFCDTVSETLAVVLWSIEDIADELGVAVSELDSAHLAPGVSHVTRSHGDMMVAAMRERQSAHSDEVSDTVPITVHATVSREPDWSEPAFFCFETWEGDDIMEALPMRYNALHFHFQWTLPSGSVQFHWADADLDDDYVAAIQWLRLKMEASN